MADPYTLEPEAVLKPERLADYEHACRVTSRALIYLHTNTRLLEQIRDFRWEFYGGPQALFGFLFHNLLEHSIGIAHRLWEDGAEDAVTLRRLRRLVLDGVRSDYADAVRERLAAIGADARLEDIFRRVDERREPRYPHDTIGYAYDPEQVQKLGGVLADLREAADLLGRTYNALTFGPARLFSLAGLAPNWLSKRGGEMGYLLDLLVLHCRWSEAYDQQREFWEDHFRDELSEDDLREINRVRLQFGQAGIPLEPEGDGGDDGAEG